MIIRRASAADIEAIADVHVQAWHEAYPDLLPQSEIEARPVAVRIGQWGDTLTKRDRPTFVAEQDGVVRGFVSGGTILWSGLATDGEVSAIYLLESIKRRGVGRLLLKTMFGELGRRGCKSAGLQVLTDNVAARRFYEAMGGRPGDTRSDRKGEFVFDEIAYIWDDLAPFALG